MKFKILDTIEYSTQSNKAIDFRFVFVLKKNCSKKHEIKDYFVVERFF